MRLIDADFEVAHWESVLLNPTPDVTEKDRRTAPYIIDALKLAGTVKDAVEVVRCKDCKHRQVNEHYGEGGYLSIKAMCALDTGDVFELGRNAWDDDWFCADGERKTDG